MSETLTSVLAGALQDLRWPVESISGESRTAVELLSIADRVAQILAEHQVQPGEPIHVRIGNRPSDLGSLLGAWQAGAVAVPIHVTAAPATVSALLNATGARFLIDADRLEICGYAPPPDRPLLREDAALVIFTSGSTGLPKGVVIGHRRLAAKLAVLERLLAFRSDDVVLVPLQLTFIFGLWVSLLALHAGARLILVPKFSPDAITKGLGGGATVLAGVPSMFRTLLADPTISMPGLRMILTGGEVLPKPLAAGLQRTAPKAAIYDLYGLTETGSCDFVVGPDDQPDGRGTIGVPTEGVAFQIGETGELQIKTPFGMLGYLDNPQLTAAAFDNGHFNTGDLAGLDPDGRVQLVGRSKDIVSRGGIKIAPLEIDNLLAEHPDVAAALCAGVPDERLGEIIHAVVVLRKGSQLTPSALRDWMLARTERFKVPDAFYFTDALPAGATGKADRRGVATLFIASREGRI